MTSSAAHRLASVLVKRHTTSSDNNAGSTSSSSSSTCPRVMATSASSHHRMSRLSVPVLLRPSQMSDRVPLCADRKGPFDHLVARPLLVSTMRVIMLQGSVTLSNFMSDQLEQEMDRELLVEQEKLTPEEADRENDEWEAREWEKRWKDYPARCIKGVLRFHAVTILMRFYETVADEWILTKCCSSPQVVMDKLTKDPFRSALRKSSSKSSKKDDNDVEQNGRIIMARDMFATCLWSNVIACLADYTVQQIIFCYGYYIYSTQRRRRTKKSTSSKHHLVTTATTTTQEDNNDNDATTQHDVGEVYTKDNNDNDGPQTNVVTEDNDTDDEPRMELASTIFILMVKSTRTFFQKSASWVAASAGGAAGSVLYPGWGTVLGTQAGETVMGLWME